MKYAVMVSQTEFPKKNIGDYVQAMAARQYQEECVFVQREKLKSYSGDSVAMIMNGWFMIHPEQFPPSEKINPLYVSFHANPANLDAMLSEGGREHLLAHQPIGCRDYGTVELLKSKGIDAYFTGCLTLTLGQKYSPVVSKRSGIYFVDPSICIPRECGRKVWLLRLIKTMPVLLLHPLMVWMLCGKATSISWVFDWTLIHPLKRVVIAAIFYREYSKYFTDRILREAVFVPQHIIQSQFRNEEEKFAYADELLKKYQHAELVVTGRIHAGLPCLGMETPVVFTNLKEQNSGNAANCGRLDGLLDLFGVIEFAPNGESIGRLGDVARRKKIKSGKDIVNKDGWRKLAKALSDKCISFIAKSVS